MTMNRQIFTKLEIGAINLLLKYTLCIRLKGYGMRRKIAPVIFNESPPTTPSSNELGKEG